jgi:hypothetical protein
MPVVRYIVWVGASLLALLLVANWCLPEPPQEAAHEVIEKPVIRIASVQHPPESIFIDTNQLTIVPPPTPLESTIIPEAPSLLQSYASVEPPPIAVGVDQKKSKSLKRQKTKVAVRHPPPVNTHVAAGGGSATTVPPTQLSLLDIVSGMGKRLFNPR